MDKHSSFTRTKKAIRSAADRERDQRRLRRLSGLTWATGVLAVVGFGWLAATTNPGTANAATATTTTAATAPSTTTRLRSASRATTTSSRAVVTTGGS